MRLDSNLTYLKEIEYATTKAVKITSQLSRLMANVGGHLQVLMLYGLQLWVPFLKVKRPRQLLFVRRTAALRVTSAYSTVSADDVLVIAGMIPVGLQQARIRNEPQAEHARQATSEKWEFMTNVNAK